MLVVTRRGAWIAVLVVALGLAGFGGAVAAQTGDGTDGDVSADSVVASGPKPVFIALPAPIRAIDTRVGYGPLITGAPLGIKVAPKGAIPADATAVVMNVTSTGATSTGNVKVYPAGVPEPTTSNLNLQPGVDVPNAVTAGVGTGGVVVFKATVNNGGQTFLVVDITGYYVDHQHSDQYQWAVVDLGGTLLSKSAGVTGATRTGTGRYVVSLDHDVTGCSRIVGPVATTSGASYDGAIASAGRATGLATDVSVHTQLAATGADTDFGFSLAVMC